MGKNNLIDTFFVISFWCPSCLDALSSVVVLQPWNKILKNALKMKFKAVVKLCLNTREETSAGRSRARDSAKARQRLGKCWKIFKI